jgi:hypothetical protein
MSTVKMKEVEVGGQSYQLRKLLPTTGGFIWQKLMAGVYKVQATAGASATDDVPAPQPSLDKVTPEERLRALCGVAFMGLSFDDFTFIQIECMKMVSRVEGAAPMPVMADNGRWAIVEVQDDPFLVTRLTVEVLVFNLCPFLAENSTS